MSLESLRRDLQRLGVKPIPFVPVGKIERVFKGAYLGPKKMLTRRNGRRPQTLASNPTSNPSKGVEELIMQRLREMESQELLSLSTVFGQLHVNGEKCGWVKAWKIVQRGSL